MADDGFSEGFWIRPEDEDTLEEFRLRFVDGGPFRSQSRAIVWALKIAIQVDKCFQGVPEAPDYDSYSCVMLVGSLLDDAISRADD